MISRVAISTLAVVVAGACDGDPHGIVDGGPATGSDAARAIDAGRGGAAEIGEWTDAPGACPEGVARRDIATAAELEAAARGEAPYDGDAPGTCYLIADGTYASASNVLMWVRAGGDSAAPRIFVGESRGGVRINARATVEADHVRIENLTFDIGPYTKDGAFNTMSVLTASDVVVSHVDFVGDCATGASGGHFEVDGGDQIVLESSLLEGFGQCGPDGHLDHGVYLAAGSRITVRNNLIRGNASRGVQLNTEAGDFGTLRDVEISYNRITGNGHADYEDGIVLNARDAGTIHGVVIERNLVYGNYYSGLRFVGDAFEDVTVRFNTFFENGTGSAASGRSEVNLDDVGSGAHTTISDNLFAPATTVLNDCYDATARGFALTGNASTVDAAGACISGLTVLDPAFTDPDGGDFHPSNAAASAYGAYAE